MTRGMGTALGLALTGLVFDLTGGTAFAAPPWATPFLAHCVLLGGRSGGRRHALSDTRAPPAIPIGAHSRRVIGDALTPVAVAPLMPAVKSPPTADATPALKLAPFGRSRDALQLGVPKGDPWNGPSGELVGSAGLVLAEVRCRVASKNRTCDLSIIREPKRIPWVSFSAA